VAYTNGDTVSNRSFVYMHNIGHNILFDCTCRALQAIVVSHHFRINFKVRIYMKMAELDSAFSLKSPCCQSAQWSYQWQPVAGSQVVEGS
jgi:hypothetical protein